MISMMALSILIFLRRGKVGHLLSSVDEQLAGGKNSDTEPFLDRPELSIPIPISRVGKPETLNPKP
jgi:hypothetical protein